MNAAVVPDEPIPKSTAWWTVALLSGLFVVSFVDRLVIGVLVEPIRASLRITDTQISLLMGFSFVTLYSVTALVLARVADVGNRKRLIVAGVLLWGCSTAGAAFANAFGVLFILRIGVGIGEAALTPAALSTISDSFPAQRRSLANSVYLAAGMVGATGAPILGALAVRFAEPIGRATRWALGVRESWQIVFFAVGVPAIVLGVLYAATVREPVRRGRPDDPGFALSDLLAHLRVNRRSYIGLFVTLGIFQIGAYAVLSWLPTFLIRHFGWSAADAGFGFGLAGLIGGPAGALAAPWLAERFGGDARALLKAGIVFVLGAPPFVLALPLAPSATVSLCLAAPAVFFLVGSGAISPIAAQLLAPNRMRGQVTAIYTSLTNLVGLGCGPLATALIAARLAHGTADLAWAMAIVLASLTPPCVAVLLWSLRGGPPRLGAISS